MHTLLMILHKARKIRGILKYFAGSLLPSQGWGAVEHVAVKWSRATNIPYAESWMLYATERIAGVVRSGMVNEMS